MNWTEELKERAKELWQSGLSARAVAAELGNGLTRNAVIGVLARMGASHRDAGFQRSPNGQRKPQAPRIRRPRKPVNFGGVWGTYPNKEAEPFVPRHDDIIPLNLSVLELTDRTCKWPYGDSPFAFCGHPVKEGKPYCGGHCALAYMKPGTPRPHLKVLNQHRRPVTSILSDAHEAVSEWEAA